MAKAAPPADPDLPVTRIVVLTKEIAEDFLSKNRPHKLGEVGTNRKASRHTVNKWIADMLNDRWILTHQGLAFGKDGFLDDGQQRLMAFLEACKRKPGLTIMTQVTWGLPDQAFPVIDTGRVRTVANVLQSAGVANSKQTGSTARLVFCYMNVPWEGPHSWNSVDELTVSATLETVAKYPAIGQAVARVMGRRIPGNPTALCAGLAICLEARPEIDWEAFMKVLETGRGFDGDRHPAYILREKGIMAQMSGKTHRNRDRAEQLAWFLLAANSYILGSPIDSLRFTMSGSKPQKFPKVTALSPQPQAEEGEE